MPSPSSPNGPDPRVGEPAPAAASDPAPHAAAWTWRAALGTVLRPEIYRMVLFIYLPLLIPLTVGLALLGRYLDGKLGWGPLPGWPVNVLLFAVLEVLGLLIVWWCYSYIILVGGGGPAPLVAKGATRLVVAGPYALTRHPSVVGKLLGALGVGFLVRSPCFVCVILPLLLAGSLFEKKFMMERRELRDFGEVYRAYQEQVPFFIPRWSAIRRQLRGDSR